MIEDYGIITPEFIKNLSAAAGPENVYTDPDITASFAVDEMPLARPYAPQVVVKPVNKHQIADILKLANRYIIPVTPRGAGTGLSGGCVPVRGGIVLSLEKMNHIIEVDPDNFTAVVEPGVTLSQLSSQIEPEGRFYPLHPGEMNATIGGNIATNAGGLNAVKYGVTRHNILGLEAVTPQGTHFSSGGKYVKSSTGYDLTQLIAGSEGTLAIITEATLKLTNRPAVRELLFAPFPNLQNAIDAVPDILGLKLTPVGIEFMEKSIIEIVENYTGKELPYHQYEAFLMIIMEGDSPNEIFDYFSLVEDICRRHGAVEALVPGSERAKRRLLEARETFYPALKSYAPMELVDVVVPRSQIARFVGKTKEIAAGYGFPIIVYGHAGDGNVHIHPVCRDMDVNEWLKKLPHFLEDIYLTGITFGGTISGEHGIGLDKKPYINLRFDREQLDIMKSIKRAFDPNNILNPGKIFD
jgi:glycolate oxidase